MASREYWQSRFIQLEQAQLNRGARYFHDLERHYNRAAREVDKELARWYTRLAVNNELSMTEAKKMLTSRELEEFRWDVEEYIEKGRTLSYSNQWARQLENASARVHISRLEAIKLQMQQQVEVLYGNELDSFDSMMRDIYTESYYRTAYEIQKGVGVGSDLMQLDTRKIDKVMSRPWAADGSNFSSRIWTQKTQLVNELNNHLTQSFIRGLSPEAATKAIAERFNVSKGQAGRLVMTETAFIHSAGQRDMFHELGVEEYEIVATLDTKTSEICRNLDGTHHPMSEYQAGVTAPPFHCWCRTTTVPYFDDEFTEDEVRAARGDDGKTYYVPSNMTYHEWKEAFVDGGSKGGLIEVADAINAARVQQGAQMMNNEDTLENSGESSIIEVESRFGIDIEDVVRKDGYITISEDDYDSLIDAHRLNVSEVERANIYGYDWDNFTNLNMRYGYVNAPSNEIINKAIRENNMQLLNKGQLRTTEHLKNAIANNVVDNNYRVERYVDGDWFADKFSKRAMVYAAKNDFESLYRELESFDFEQIITDRQFVSCSMNDNNVYNDRKIKLIIEVPKGTNALVTENRMESELLMYIPSYRVKGIREGKDIIINNTQHKQVEVLLEVVGVGE